MSQTTEIPFIGVHNTTTENLNENGEVAMSFGLTSNDVAATTTMPAVTHLYHIDGCRILLIHNGSGFKNVFVARPSYDENGEVKKWTTEEGYSYMDSALKYKLVFNAKEEHAGMFDNLVVSYNTEEERQKDIERLLEMKLSYPQL